VSKPRDGIGERALATPLDPDKVAGNPGMVPGDTGREHGERALCVFCRTPGRVTLDFEGWALCRACYPRTPSRSHAWREILTRWTHVHRSTTLS